MKNLLVAIILSVAVSIVAAAVAYKWTGDAWFSWFVTVLALVLISLLCVSQTIFLRHDMRTTFTDIALGVFLTTALIVVCLGGFVMLVRTDDNVSRFLLGVVCVALAVIGGNVFFEAVIKPIRIELRSASS